MRKKRDIVDFKQHFGSEQGKRVLQVLERKFPWCKRLVSPVAPMDTNTVMVMQGEANVIKFIYQMMQRDPNEAVEVKQAINITSGTEDK